MKVRHALAPLIAGALLVPLAAGGAGPAEAPKPETLQVFAAASLTDAFTELGRTLQARRPGLAVRFNFAGSQQLAAQLEQGAEADVYAPADERWMSEVRAKGLVAGAPLTFAVNRLVVIVPAKNPAGIESVKDLARPGVKLVLGAEAVPVGGYSRRVLANLARDSTFGAAFAEAALRNVVSEEENVKSVLAKVRLGEADAGIVYQTDVTPAVASDVRAIEIPPAENVAAPYPIAILRGAKAPMAARAFAILVVSDEGRRVLERYGFSAPGAASK